MVSCLLCAAAGPVVEHGDGVGHRRVLAEHVVAGLERSHALVLDVPAPHELAGDDVLVGEQRADVVGGRALGNGERDLGAGRARWVELTLHPDGADPGEAYGDEEEAEHESQHAAPRRSPADRRSS